MWFTVAQGLDALKNHGGFSGSFCGKNATNLVNFR
jgi:hypothetical protein